MDSTSIILEQNPKEGTTQKEKSIKSIIEDEKNDKYIEQILIKQKFNSDLYNILEKLKKLKNEDDTPVIKEFVVFLKENETKDSLMEFIEYIRKDFLLHCIISSKNSKIYDYIVNFSKNHEKNDVLLIKSIIDMLEDKNKTNIKYFTDAKPILYTNIVLFAQNMQKIMVTFLEK